MGSESIREIVRDKLVHAFIGGLAAVALVFFHEKFQEATGLGEFAFLGLVLLVVFLFLAALEFLLGWIWTIPKIRLPAAGKIDGVWLHARYDASTGEMVGGSVVHVKTNSPDHFHVSGKSYLKDGNYDGWFDGEGVRDRDNGFVYYYHGEQARGLAPTKEGSGTGQYRYMRPNVDQTVEGSFSAHGLTKTQFVRGKRHGKRIDEKKQTEILLEYLIKAPQSVDPET